MNQIFGGLLIGLAASMMLLFSGKVAGISGIMGGILNTKTHDKSWRVLFLLGLLLGGVSLKLLAPQVFSILSSAEPFDYVVAGFLVGFGTLMGNGCTSGHGVCGISRFSSRSIIATLTFMFAGVISVAVFKFMRGEL